MHITVEPYGTKLGGNLTQDVLRGDVKHRLEFTTDDAQTRQIILLSKDELLKLITLASESMHGASEVEVELSNLLPLPTFTGK